MTVLIVTTYFLPGYKAGGILRSVVNTLNTLGKSVSFDIITSDRDITDVKSYPSIIINKRQHIDHYGVTYLSSDLRGYIIFLAALFEPRYNIIHVNSFFDLRFSLFIFLLSPILTRSKLLLLSPRGEFRPGCLLLKTRRKLLYLFIFNLFGLHKNFIFHASNNVELEDIKRVIPVPTSAIRVAPDLPTLVPEPTFSDFLYNPDHLRLIFLSRITPEKNLTFALKLLSRIKRRIEFDIYGHIQDEFYWDQVTHAIASLPNNISTRYLGPVEPSNIHKVFSQYDIFFFPSQGENFGHVIIESLLSGTPVLTSDQVPWNDLQHRNAGWNIPLHCEHAYESILNNFSYPSLFGRVEHASQIHKSALSLLKYNTSLEANRSLYILS